MVSFKIVLAALFLVLIASITVLGIVAYQNNKTSNETAALVAHTHDVIDVSTEISLLYKNIQLESNAFFITKDSATIELYSHAHELLLFKIDTLKVLAVDAGLQQDRTDSLRLLISELLLFNDSAIAHSQKASTLGEIRNHIKINGQFRIRIRKIIREIISAERHLLSIRQHAYEESVLAFNKTFYFLISAIGIVLAATFFSIRYNFNKRVKAESELQNINDLFIKLFYESPIGIVITKKETGVIVDCNHAFTALIQYNKSELLGKTPGQLKIMPESYWSEVVSLSKGKVAMKDISAQLKPKNEKPVWVSVSIQSIEVNNEACLLNAILDMTVHKEAEEKMQQALESEIQLNKLKSNFISLASHEFRTPLSTILSSAFLLESYVAGENKDKLDKHVSRIRASVNLLTSVLDEFLSLTKIEEGKVEPKIEKVNLKDTLESLCQNSKIMAKSGQSILYNHTGATEFYTDPVLVSNIVNNLLSNAIKYSPENAQIHVSSHIGNQVKLIVRDFGIGISTSDQAHLFERFFRASNTGNIQGTGLGLHILKHYVDLLKGSIEVKSEPGKGSEFIITLELNHASV